MAIKVSVTYREKNLARLRAVAYKLEVMKNRVDAIIARLEKGQHDKHFDHNDFSYDHVQHLDTYTGRLSEQVLSALQEVKG